MSHKIRVGQALMEYMLLTALVAFLVFMAFQPGGILDQTRDKAGTLFVNGAKDIIGQDIMQ